MLSFALTALSLLLLLLLLLFVIVIIAVVNTGPVLNTLTYTWVKKNFFLPWFDNWNAEWIHFIHINYWRFFRAGRATAVIAARKASRATRASRAIGETRASCSNSKSSTIRRNSRGSPASTMSRRPRPARTRPPSDSEDMPSPSRMSRKSPITKLSNSRHAWRLRRVWLRAWQRPWTNSRLWSQKSWFEPGNSLIDCLIGSFAVTSGVACLSDFWCDHIFCFQEIAFKTY